MVSNINKSSRSRANTEKKKKDNERKENELKQKKEQKIIEIYNRQKFNDFLHSVLLIIGLIFGYVGDELIEVNIDGATVPFSTQILRGLNTVFCAPLIYFAYRHYSFLLDVMKERKQIYHKSTFSSNRSPLLEEPSPLPVPAGGGREPYPRAA